MNKKKWYKLDRKAKGRILRWIMNVDLLGIILYTMSIIEAEKVNWAQYGISIAVMSITFLLAYWMYVAKAYERVSDDV